MHSPRRETGATNILGLRLLLRAAQEVDFLDDVE